MGADRKVRNVVLAIGVAVGICTANAAMSDTPKRGGVLKFVVGSKIPSYDGHGETTFGMIHPIRPFYSLLIRLNPDTPQSTTDFVCDVCAGTVPTPSDDGLTYTFKIRDDIRFHDGTPLTAVDVKATYEKIIFPPEGVVSRRKIQYGMVDSISAPDKYTVVFRLKYPSGGFIPALASPFNFIYAKKDLDAYGYDWHRTNINGTGAFRFKQHLAGVFVEGVRYDGYHHPGKPYLDGFKAIAAPKMSVRIEAIRSDRAAIEFRGFPPKARDEMVAEQGDKITVQESDWSCMQLVVFNSKRKPYGDPRVRKALSLAIDRWAGSEKLSRMTTVKTVAGIVFAGHPYAASRSELEKIAGFWPDIDKSRAEARRLLKEAGQENLNLTLLNRTVGHPYRAVGEWLVEQWKQIDVTVTHKLVSSGDWYSTVRKTRDFGVTLSAACHPVVNPTLNISDWIKGGTSNYARIDDQVLDDLFLKANRSTEPAEQRRLIRQFETHALDKMAYQATLFWWYKINVHRSYLKGWRIPPSHYTNQHLDQVWLDR